MTITDTNEKDMGENVPGVRIGNCKIAPRFVIGGCKGIRKSMGTKICQGCYFNFEKKNLNR